MFENVKKKTIDDDWWRLMTIDDDWWRLMTDAKTKNDVKLNEKQNVAFDLKIYLMLNKKSKTLIKKNEKKDCLRKNTIFVC